VPSSLRAGPRAGRGSPSEGASLIFGFGRARRLLRSEEFAGVLRRGRRVSGPNFQVIALPNGKNAARLGLIMAKKAEPLAVRRNYFKRLVRESFRRQLQDIGALDVVVQLRGSKGGRPAGRALLEELQGLFERLNACRG